MSEPVMDWPRHARIGIAEAVLCEGKTPQMIASVLSLAENRPLLLTRLSPDQLDGLPAFTDGKLDYDPLSRTAFWQRPVRAGGQSGSVAIVAAGLADAPTAREAQRTLQFANVSATMITDVGAAGLWRLEKRLDEIRQADVVITVAGMEGALFTVLGGLVAAPVIACPSPVGYGMGANGAVAVLSALSSCADGLTVTNIGNGYGAACAALRILNLVNRATDIATRKTRPSTARPGW